MDDDPNKKSVVIVFPGLLGGSNSNYSLKLSSKLEKAGHIVGVYNNEGIDGTPLLNDRLIDFTCLESTARALRYVKERFPKKNLYCVCFSFGCTRLMKVLSEMKDANEVVQGFIAVSNPFNLNKSGHAVSTLKKNALYSWSYTGNMKNYLRSHLPSVTKRSKEANIDLGTPFLLFPIAQIFFTVFAFIAFIFFCFPTYLFYQLLPANLFLLVS